jgi:hypothetical protein
MPGDIAATSITSRVPQPHRPTLLQFLAGNDKHNKLGDALVHKSCVSLLLRCQVVTCV